MTQCDMILRYMEETGGITPWEAMKEFGCMRLGARIWDLRHQGHPIERTMVVDFNRFGKRVRYARYVLPEE